MKDNIQQSSTDDTRMDSSSIACNVVPLIQSMNDSQSPPPLSVSLPSSMPPMFTCPPSPLPPQVASLGSLTTSDLSCHQERLAEFPSSGSASYTKVLDSKDPRRSSSRRFMKLSVGAGPKDSDHIAAINNMVDNHDITEQSHGHLSSENLEIPASHPHTTTLPLNRTATRAANKESIRLFFSRFYHFIKVGCGKGISRMKKKISAGRKGKANNRTRAADNKDKKSKATAHKESASTSEEPENDSHEFIRTIQVALIRDDKEMTRTARAKFDTGNPYNLVSRDFIENTFNIQFIRFPEGNRELLQLPNGHKFLAIGKITGRWSVAINSRDKKAGGKNIRFHPKFYDSDFYVSGTEELFDVVIGSETIEQYNLIDFQSPLGLTGFDGFRLKNPPSVKGNELEAAHSKQQTIRANNAVLKESHMQQKNKSAGATQTEHTTSGYSTSSNSSQS